MFDFDCITVEEALNLLKQHCPEMRLDIEAFYPSLLCEEEVRQTPLMEAIGDYDSTLYRERNSHETMFIADMFYDELLRVVKKIDADATWILIGDALIKKYEHEKFERCVVYDLEERKAQFATIGYKQTVDIYYTYQGTHQTDGISINQVVTVRR